MTIAKFRNIELLIFTAISIILDFVLGHYGLFGLRMYFALSYPLIFLMYIRWRKWGIVTNIAVVISHIFIYWNNPSLVILAHCVSIMGFALMLWFGPKLQSRIHRFDTVAGSYTGIYLIMIMVEWGLLSAFGQNVALGNHLVNHVVNLLLGLLILLIIHFQKELIIDMQNYFETKDKEKDLWQK